MTTDAAPPPYPTTPETLTPEWLVGVLRRHHADVPDIRGFDTAQIGTGQVGRCIRYTIDYSSEPPPVVPRAVVGKFASDNAESREAGKAGGCYVLEVGFYRDLQATVGIRTPRCYFAAIGDGADPEVDHALILEDMAPAAQGDQISGCTVDQAAAALEEAARLHAPRWSDSSLQSISWLRGAGSEPPDVAGIYELILPAFEQRYDGRLDDATLGIARDLAPALAGLIAEADGPRTIVHGDYRIDNMLFGDGRSAPAVSVVDWQTVSLGIGASDAAYFVGAGLTTELRREHERRLVDEYHASLVAGGVTGYDWEACWRDYRRGTVSGLIMAVVASMMVGATERGDEMFMTMARRHAAHAIDLNAREFFPS